MISGNRKTVYRDICDYVQTLIAKGDIAPDGRLPTENQLCRHFSTSRSTVVKAMKELEWRGIIRRKAGSGSFAVQSPENKCTYAALLIAGLGDIEFFSQIGASIAMACQKYNISLIWGNTGPATEIATRIDIDRACARLREQQVEGVFFAPDQVSQFDHVGEIHPNIYLAEQLEAAGIAVVLIDRDLTPYPERSRYDFVGIDNVNAAFQQVMHLYQRGCRKIIHVTRPGELTTKTARIAGFRTAMRHLGMPDGDELIFSGDSTDPQFVKQTLAVNPDGVTCFNDPVGSRYLTSLINLGIAVPESVKVIGLDDLEYSKMMPVPMSTLKQPRREIGEAAVEILVRRMANRKLPPTLNLLTAPLVPRQSTALKGTSAGSDISSK